MSSSNRIIVMVGFLAGCLMFGSQASAQSSQSQSGQQPGTTSKDQKPADSGSTLAIPTTQPPVSPEEDAAAKAFQGMPNTDLPKKIAAGEEFLAKYPESRYRSPVYSALTMAYLQTGNTAKGFEMGDKEVALKPDDVQILAILSQTITRSMNAGTPEPAKQLAKAETYAKRAIELTPSLAKPEGMADQNFIVAKNETLTMAHSGLGLAYLREGKYNEAIPELEQSVKIDPNPTPEQTNLYLLGLANQKASHFDQAAVVFGKCAAMAGQLQGPCKTAADEAKKQSSTQLSAPK
jgi:tetratricopeptide (TPR) repeat protein